jgi:hypothetical protein
MPDSGRILVALAVVCLVFTAGCSVMNTSGGATSYEIYIHPDEEVPADRASIAVDNQTLAELEFVNRELSEPPSSSVRQVELTEAQYDQGQSVLRRLPASVAAEDDSELYVSADGAVYRVEILSQKAG